MPEGKVVLLKVAEAMRNDVGRWIARMDAKSREELGVSTGDVVKLSGKKAAYALVWPSHPDDEGQGMARIDGILRQNAGVGLGDKVRVGKADAKDAKKVVLAPREPVRFYAGFDQYLKSKLVGKPVLKGNVLPVGVFGAAIQLVVVNTAPAGGVMISEKTEVILRPEVEEEAATITGVTYDDIGGLGETVQKIREMVELPLRHPELFEKLGIEPPKGVLLHGAPGTGKTLLAKAVANESDANFFYIGGPEVVSKFVGESEQRLRELFKQAQENSPSIIFIDEIDAIAPKREEVTGEVERRMVSQLLTLMDGMKSRGEVIVIAATNRVDSIDPALRRPGRFDREIEIGVPDRTGRKEILQIHTRNMPLTEDVNLDEIASLTHGYTGADISALTKEAAIKALRRILPKIKLEDEFIAPEVLEELKVTRDDFLSAMHGIQPSALREVFVERPNVHWDDIGGLENMKRELKEALELPLKKPEVFEKMGIRPLKGILLYGAPGTGKTLLAKAVATESEANFIAINGPEILSKWVGESEKTLRELFRKAKQAAPCILFIDEIDGLAPIRGAGGGEGTMVSERLVDTLLTEMDGLKSMKKVVVLGATNRPDILDKALMRAGRFDRVIEIPMPDEKTRLEIFRVHTKKMPLKGVDVAELAKETEGYSGADIENVCREAGMMAIRAGSANVTKQHFAEAMKSIAPRIQKSDVERVKKFKTSFTEAMYR
ncbi:MAG: CDC48 family AAA ATPase [Candidatus ainarchaeum sp.]|nr:CDC48 family AAA ATPase [Candidatus ainarchaeum sp.]MDD5096250.1 CDC48 family AAA ATPase [Candidatus ainarchaeum sp.]